MAVVNTQRVYDHPHYITRRFSHGGDVAAGTLTVSAKLLAVQAYNLYSVTGYLTAAGTVSTAAIDAIKVEGTTTTTMATNVIGTSAAKGTFTIDLTTSGVAPTTLAQGGYAYIVNRLDATVASIVGWEYGAQVGGNISSPG